MCKSKVLVLGCFTLTFDPPPNPGFAVQITPVALEGGTEFRQTAWTRAPWASTTRPRLRNTSPRKVGPALLPFFELSDDFYSPAVVTISCFKHDWPDSSGLSGIYTRVNRHVVLSLISSSLSIFPAGRQITQRASVASLALRQTRWIKAPWASSTRAKQRSMNPRKVGSVALNIYLDSLYLETHLHVCPDFVRADRML